MAYLDPETLTCPGCGATAPIEWVVGEGPNTGPGEGPAYVSATPSLEWKIEPRGNGAAAICVRCAVPVAERQP